MAITRRQFMKDAALLAGSAALPFSIGACRAGSRFDPVRFWAIQLQKVNWKELEESHYDMLVVDDSRTVRGMEGEDTGERVRRLKGSAGSAGQKKLAVAYIPLGEASDFRWYWKDGWKPGNPGWLLGADPEGWAGSYAVRYWAGEWREIVFAHLDRILEDGFDGILMDWVGAFETGAVKKAAQSDGIDPVAGMIWLVEQVRRRAKGKNPDFQLIGLNASALAALGDYRAAIDAMMQEGLTFNGSYGEGRQGDVAVPEERRARYVSRLSLLAGDGKPVFVVDYATAPGNAKAAYDFAARNGFRAYVTTLLLDGLTKTPPPGY